MCNVKSGNALKNLQDVQNLVIGIINRQRKRYVKEDIYEAVAYHTRGANVEINQDKLKDMIDDNLAFMYRKGMVDCRWGYFFPQNVSVNKSIK